MQNSDSHPVNSMLLLAPCKLDAITGKYENNVNNKLCKMCDINDTKFDFELVCPKYLILRQKYIKPYYSKKPSVYKLCHLLISSRNSLSILCKNFSEAFIHRNNVICVVCSSLCCIILAILLLFKVLHCVV